MNFCAGPAIGGSIGLMFTIANTISVGTYTVGFATSVSDLLQDAVPGWQGIIDTDCRQAGCRDNDIRVIGGPVLCLFLVITFAGMDWVTRIQKFLLVLLICAQADMLAGSFLDLEWGTCYVQKDTAGNVKRMTQDQRHAYGYSGWSMETVKDNINPDYVESPISANPSFMETFGVFFTAVTGIVAGANLSGDLKDPSLAIPQGTLIAIAGTYITYMYFGLQTSFVFNKKASGVSEEYRYFNGKGLFQANGTNLVEDPLFFNQSFWDMYPEYNDTKKQFIQLPKWISCNEADDKYRDYLKFFALPHLDRINGLSDNKFTDVYDKWNTVGALEEDENGREVVDKYGECSFGSGQNQMTMTYISFTGWLR